MMEQEDRPVIREAILSDVNNLVELHSNNFHNNDLSVILGRQFIEKFYIQAIVDKNTIVKIIEIDNRLIALSLIYLKYGQFEKQFKRQSFGIFLKYMLTGLLALHLKSLVFVVKAVISRKMCRYVDNKVYDYYVGSFILDRQHRDSPAIVQLFYMMYKQNIDFLKTQSQFGCWGICRESNNAAARLLKNEGLTEEHKMKSFPENMNIFVYRKGNIHE